MRVRVFKRPKGKFKVLLTNRGRRSYQVKLLPEATRDELKTTLLEAIVEMASTGGQAETLGLAIDG